uniref:Vomeronasal type-1 receptor n=1 Tax=Nannospalax galili TaxID=1026970 RepID=A0A8C6W198_NANGA
MVLNAIEITMFLLLTGFGTVGNISVFVNYMCASTVGNSKKSISFILIHVAFTNIIMLFQRECYHIVVYLERVARGLSICTSSLLTVVQAITISPRACVLGRLRLRSTQHVLLSLLFFWILNPLISMNLLHSIRNRSMNPSQLSKSDKYCYFKRDSQKINSIFLTLMVLRDAMLLSVMGGTSGYLILLLQKHHQRVLYLQNSKFLYTTPPELRAAHSVLLLMLCFLFFYWADCAISLYLTFSLKNDSLTMHLQEFMTLGYAVLSPFVLIHRDGHLAECWPAQ